jgi:hypothetical protein
MLPAIYIVNLIVVTKMVFLMIMKKIYFPQNVLFVLQECKDLLGLLVLHLVALVHNK